jgi:hypothetical protein
MEQPSPTINDLSPEEPPMPLGARLANVFAAPGEVFDDIRVRPVKLSNWLVPGLLLVVVSWIAAWFIFSQPSVQQQLAEFSDRAVQQQAERMKASPEQTEKMKAAAAKFGGIGQKIAAVATPLVTAFVFPIIWGAFLWLIGNKILHASFGFMKAVEVVGLSNMIAILDAVVRTLLIVIMGSIWAGPHAGMLVSNYDPENPVHGVLAALSIMSLWILAVRSVGLAKLTGISFGKAAAWVFGLWIAYTGFFVGVAVLMRAIFSR